MVYHHNNMKDKCFRKQPSIGVLIKRLSGNMQQIYRRAPMPKCDCKANLLKSHFGMGVLL